MASEDRTVHGRTADGSEVVRYARSGKWFIERADGQRRRVGVFDAAHAAALGRAFLGLPGGSRFDAAVRMDGVNR